MRAQTIRRSLGAPRGVVLLEVLVSVLIFAFGLLALASLQSAAVKDSLEAKFRADASLLVDDLIGRMYAAERTPAGLDAAFATGQDGFNAWLAAARAKLPTLDAQETRVSILPVAGGAGLAATRVEIQLAWRGRSDAARPLHRLVSVTEIGS